MITEIVLFDLPAGISRDELMAKYLSTAQAWAKNKDLIEKYYFYDSANNKGGGVYIWKSEQAMNRWHSEEYKTRIKEIYGSEPQMMYFDSLVHIDNLLGKIEKFEKA